MPQTTQIIEYRFGVNSFGVSPFFAKLELSQDDYIYLIGQSPANEENLRIFERMQQNFDHSMLCIDNISEIRWRERMTSKTSFFLFSSTRTIDTLIVETIDVKYFLYVFYQL